MLNPYYFPDELINYSNTYFPSILNPIFPVLGSYNYINRVSVEKISSESCLSIEEEGQAL